jgi:hypothetical protein
MIWPGLLIVMVASLLLLCQEKVAAKNSKKLQLTKWLAASLAFASPIKDTRLMQSVRVISFGKE